MVSLFATGTAKNTIINNINDDRILNFEKSLHEVLLNLAKRVTADGEGASKFISIYVDNAKTHTDAKKLLFQLQIHL